MLGIEPLTTQPNKKRGKNPETFLTQQITRYLKTLGSDCWYNKNAGFATTIDGRHIAQKRGIPDLTVIYNGVVYWLEIKTPVGRLSESQIAQHEKMLQAGGKVFVVRSVDDVKSVLNGGTPNVVSAGSKKRVRKEKIEAEFLFSPEEG